MDTLLRGACQCAAILFLLGSSFSLSTAQFVVENPNGNPNTEAVADDVNICFEQDGEGLLSFRLVATGASTDPTLTIDLATGREYVPGTMMIVAQGDAGAIGGPFTIVESGGTPEAPEFTVMGTFSTGDYVQLEMQKVGTCEAQSMNGLRDVISIVGDAATTTEMSGTHDALFLTLTFEDINPVVGNLGDMLTLTGSITGGGNGCVDTIVFMVIDDAGVTTTALRVEGNTLTADSTSADTSYYTIGVDEISLVNMMGNNPNCLEIQESLEFERDVTISSCEVDAGYQAFWGCNGERCFETAVVPHQINMTGAVPRVDETSRVAVQLTNTCDDLIYDYTFTNNGTGDAFNLSNMFGMNASGLVLTHNDDVVVLTEFSVGGNVIAVSGVGSAADPLRADYSLFGMVDPDGPGGLSALNPDGVFDDLPVGESVTVRVTWEFECRDNCPTNHSTSGTRASTDYQDQCGNQLNRVIISGAPSSQNAPLADPSVSGPSNIFDNDIFTVEMCMARRESLPDNSSFYSCPSDSLVLTVDLPAGFVPQPGTAMLNGAMVPFVRGVVDTSLLYLIGEAGAFVNNFCFAVDLQLLCGGYTGETTFDFEVSYQCDVECPCIERWGCTQWEPNVICPGLCPEGGLTIGRTSATRATLGYTDGFKTERVDVADLPAVSLTRALECDTVCWYLPSEQKNGTSGGDAQNRQWDNGWLRIEYMQQGGANVFDYSAGGEVTWYDATALMGSEYTTCPLGVPTNEMIEGGLHIVEWDLSSCLNGGVLEPGDSMNVTLKPVVEINDNLPVVPVQVEGFRLWHYNVVDPMVAGVDGPDAGFPDRYFCLRLGLEQYLHQYNQTTRSGTGNQTPEGCNSYDVRLNLRVAGLATDFYPGEFRPDIIVDSIRVNYSNTNDAWNPAGTTQIVFQGDETLGGANTIALGAPDRDDGTYFIWYNDGTWPCGDERRENGNSTFDADMIPSCESVDGSIPVQMFFRNRQYTTNTECHEDQSLSTPGPVTHSLPTHELTDLTGLVLATQDTVSWLVDIRNTENVSSGNVWIALHSAVGIQIDSVINADVDTTLTLITYGDSVWARVSENFLATEQLAVRVFGTIDACVDASVQMDMGWNCAGYPDPNPAVYPCPVESVILEARPLLSQVQIEIDQEVGPYPLCEEIDDRIIITSALDAYITDLLLCIPLPPGLTEDDAEVQVEYPAGSGNLEPFDIVTSPGGADPDTIYIDLNTHTEIAALGGIPGTLDAGGDGNNSMAIVNITWLTDCDFLVGDTYRPRILANRPCGDPALDSGVPTESDPILIQGLDAPFLVEILPDIAVDTIRGCMNETIMVNSTIFSGDMTTENDSIYITLPSGTVYVEGTFMCTSVECPVVERIDDSGSEQVIVLSMPVGVEPVTELTFEFGMMPVPGGLCNESGEVIIESISSIQDVECDTEDSGFCDNIQILNGSASDTIYFEKTVAGLSALDFVCIDDRIFVYEGFVTIDSLELTADDSIEVKIFCAGDPMTAIDSVTVFGPVAEGDSVMFMGTIVNEFCGQRELIFSIIGDENCVCDGVSESIMRDCIVPEIEVEKNIISAMETAVEGQFMVTYEVKVKNPEESIVDLDSLEIIDDLSAQLGATLDSLCSPAVTISMPPSMGGNIMANPNYGTGDDWDLTVTTPPDTLYSGDSVIFEICAFVAPCKDPTLLSKNIVTATGEATVAPIEVMGMDMDTLRVPHISVGKELVSCVAANQGTPTCNGDDNLEGLVQADFILTIQNTGTIAFDSLEVVEDFVMQYMAAFVDTIAGSLEVLPGDATTPPAANAAWDGGMTDDELLDQTSPVLLEQGQTFQIVFSILVDPDAVMPSDTLFNSAIAIGHFSDTTDLLPDPAGMVQDSSDNGPDPKGPNGDDSFDTPTPGFFPAIGLAKTVDTFELLHTGLYKLTLGIVVANLGNDTLTSLQVTDALVGQLGCAFMDSVNVMVADEDGDVAAGGGVLPGVNANYNGGDVGVEAQLLDGMGSLPPGTEFEISLMLQIDPDCGAPDKLLNIAEVTAMGTSSGKGVSDLSDDGTDPMGTNGDGCTEDPTVIEIPALGVSKEVTSIAAGEWPNQQVVRYTIRVQNTGNAPIDTISLKDDIATTYGPAFDSASIVSGTFMSDNMSGIENADFDGGMSSDTVVSNAALLAGEMFSVEIEVVFNLDELPKPDNLANSAVAMGTALGCLDTLMVMDSSEIGDNPDGGDHNFDWNVNTPTPIPTTGGISVAKAFVMDSTELQHNGNYRIVYCYHVQNVGTDTLLNVSLTDDLIAQFGCVFQGNTNVMVIDSTVLMSGGVLPASNDDFGTGAGPGAEMLDQSVASVLPPWSKFKVQMSVEVDPDCKGAPDTLQNQATATAETSDGSVVTDLSDAGLDPLPENAPGTTHDDPTITDIPGIGVSKMVMDVQPGVWPNQQVVTYLLKVQNTGNVNLTNIELTDDVVDQYMGAALADSTCIVPGTFVSENMTTPGTENDAFDGTGQNATIITGASLASCEGFEVKIKTLIDLTLLPKPDTLANSATAAGLWVLGPQVAQIVTDSSEIGDNPDGSDVDGDWNVNTPTPLPTIGNIAISKLYVEDSTVLEHNGFYSVTYCMHVQNIGTDTLTGVQVVDNILDFGCAYQDSAFVLLVDSTVAMLGGELPTLNPDFTGAGPGANMLMGDDGILPPWAKFKLELTLMIDPDCIGAPAPLLNQAEVSATSSSTGAVVTDLSDEGADPLPDNTVGSTHDDPTRTDIVAIGVSKELSDCMPLDDVDGNYLITYTFKVQNTGNQPLDSVELEDPILAELMPAGVSAMVIGGVTGAGVVQPGGINDDYTGMGAPSPGVFDGPTDILDGTAILNPGDVIEVQIQVEVDASEVPWPDTLFNSGVAFANDTIGRMAMDSSENALLPNGQVPPGGGVPDGSDITGDWNVNTPTPLKPLPAIGVTKIQVACQDVGEDRDGNVVVTFEYVIKNIGSSPLENIQLIEDFSANANLGTSFVRVVADSCDVVYGMANAADSVGMAPTKDPNFDGAPNDIDVFDGVSGLLFPGDSLVVTLAAEIDPNALLGYPGTLPIENSADAEGEFETVVVDDESFNDADPEGGDSATVVSAPALGLLKQAIECVPDIEDVADMANGQADVANFDVTYKYTLVNVGTDTIEMLQVSDTLVNLFQDAFIGVEEQPVVSGNAVEPPTAAMDFDGDAQPNLLIGTDGILAPGDSICIVIEVEVDPNAVPPDPVDTLFNSALATGLAPDVEGNPLAKEISDPSDNGDAEGGDDPTGIGKGDVNITKDITEIVKASSGVPGNVDASFKLVIKNKGNVDLVDVTVIDDVERLLGPAYVGVVELPMIDDATNPNTPAFGAFPPEILIGNVIDSLAPNDSICITFTLELDPNAEGAEKVLKNYAIVVAEDAFGTEYQDTSDAGYLPEDFNMDHPDDPSMPPLNQLTPSANDPLCLWLPSVGLAKKLLRVQPPTAGIHEVQKPWQFEACYKMVLENTGNTDLDSIELVDTISEQWGGIAPEGAFIRIKPFSLEIVGDESNATFLSCFEDALNIAYDGTPNNPVILMPDSCRLLCGERITIEFKVAVSAKYGPEEDDLLNQAYVWGRGIRPAEAATKPGEPVTVLDYEASIAAGMMVRDTVWAHDLSDCGLDPESYNEDDPFDMGTADDPTVLPNCWQNACDLTCVGHIEKPLGQDCEVELTADMVSFTLDPVCVELGFYNVEVFDPTGAKVPNNTITRDMTRFSDGPYDVCINNIVCPEQFCCTELTIREIKEPWIEGALDTTIYCIDPFLDLSPNDAAYPKPEVRPSCEGLGVRGPIFDYEWVEGNLPCESPYSKIIYRIWYATDAVGDNRVEIYDEIYVLKLPELTTDNIWCPPNVDQYCGDEDLECTSPRVILPNPSPFGGSPDTLCLAPGFDTLTGKCGVFVKLLSHDFNGSECPSVHREVFEIKQTCFNPNIQALPAPEVGGIEEIGDNYFECTWWRTVYDTLAPWVECTEPFDTVPTGSHECAAHIYLNDVQVSDECSEIKAVKAEVVELGLRTLMDSIGYDEDTEKVIYGNHRDMFKLAVGTNYTIVYEAIDQCHNSAYDTCYIYVKDLTDPVVVVDKGITVSLSDKKVWVNAEDFDEGSWDNCGINLFLARRADWYSEIACVDLCDDVELCYASEHHDSLWTSILEEDKAINEVEAHYAKFLEWMKSDGTPCGDLVYNSWMYDLIKHTTINCPDHPYELTDVGVHKLIVEADSMDASKFLLGPDTLLKGNALDAYSQIGGGWSDAVPFSCEDACGSVTVEVIAFDYWCNWSTGWVDVWVEDKTPITVVKDIVDGDITCKTYKTKRYEYPGEEHPVGIDYIVDQAVAGSEDAYASLDEIFGGYCKAWLDDHGNYVDESGEEIDCDIEFIDSSCFCEDTLVQIRVYDEHLGYIWKDSLISECGYNEVEELFQKGIVQVNCGQNAKCAQDVWLDLDHCGQGYIYRKFKIWQECTDPEKETVHIPDTIYRQQRIFVGNDCELDKGMFEMPYDTTIEACGIEYDPDGSGNIIGEAGPGVTGAPKYLFDDDCRIVGVAREDKVFKVVGGDEGCLKIIRTWYFADWCDSGTPANENWYEDGEFVDFTCQQKILVIDTQEPVCMITVSNSTESGSGTAEDPAEIVPAGGCYVTLSGFVDIMDPCGLIELDWEVKDLKTEEVVRDGMDVLEGTMSTYEFAIADLEAGEYKFQVRVTDECQNESYCDYFFTVGAGKKPGPVCVTSLTVELTPWDSNQDGTPDTAKASIPAVLFESSSLPPCEESYDDLMFKIEWTAGSTDEYDAERVGDTLHVGCDQGAGTHSARMWVVSPSGTADYCEVFVVVLDNTGACGDVSGSSVITGMVTNLSGGEIDGAEVSARKSAGEIISSMETSKTGSYTLGSPFGADLEVQAVKDGDDRNGVSTLDLIAMQRHLLGKDKLSGLLQEAADVSNDGRVSVRDVVQLRKLILGTDTEFSNSNSWRFYSVDGSKEMYEIVDFADRMELDWKGVKIGDLNLDYDPRRAQGRSSRSMVLDILDEQLEAGTKYRISFTASEEMKDLLGYQYTMQFDPNQVRIVDIDASSTLPITKDNFGQRDVDQGKLTVSWHDIAGAERKLSAGDVLYSVVLEAKTATRLSDVLTLSSEITRAEAYNGENETMDVSLQFVGNGQLARGFELHQNRPNPFQGRTMISFSLPESQRAVLTVFDATGRSIQRIEQVFSKGYNALELDLNQVAAQGILYYQLDTKDFTASRKMTMVN